MEEWKKSDRLANIGFGLVGCCVFFLPLPLLFLVVEVNISLVLALELWGATFLVALVFLGLSILAVPKGSYSRREITSWGEKEHGHVEITHHYDKSGKSTGYSERYVYDDDKD